MDGLPVILFFTLEANFVFCLTMNGGEYLAVHFVFSDVHQNSISYRIPAMEKDYQKLFQALGNPAIPVGLRDSVLARIDNEVRRASIIRLAVFVPLTLIAGVATVVSFQYLARETAQSGLSEYLSILFSDGGTMLSYWKEFLISLAEAAPVFGMAVFLGAVLSLLGSLKAAIKNVQTTFTHIQLA